MMIYPTWWFPVRYVKQPEGTNLKKSAFSKSPLQYQPTVLEIDCGLMQNSTSRLASKGYQPTDGEYQISLTL